jgi:hypothetical protein
LIKPVFFPSNTNIFGGTILNRLILGVLIFISVISCGKKENKVITQNEDTQKTTQVTNTAAKQDSKQNDIYYTKNLMNLGYINRDDVGKKWQQLPKGTYHRLGIGAKVVCEQVEYDGEKEIFLVEMENSKKVWMDFDDLSKGVIVINKPNIITYEIPDTDWMTKQNVQQGDLGYIITSYKDWLFVDFRGYRAYEENEEKVWIGRKWIKNTGYIMNPDLAGQAMYLYFAYYQIMKDRIDDAVTNLNYAKKITSDFPFMNRLLDSMLNEIAPTTQNAEESSAAEENENVTE